MVWVIGTVGIMMGTFVAVIGGDDRATRLPWAYRNWGVLLLVLAVVLMFLGLVNALILGG